MSKVTDFRVGDFVEMKPKDNQFGGPKHFVGEVLGLTVNLMGEPILKLRTFARKFSPDMEGLDYVKLYPENDACDLYVYEGPMHPSNVQPLSEKACLKRV